MVNLITTHKWIRVLMNAVSLEIFQPLLFLSFDYHWEYIGWADFSWRGVWRGKGVIKEILSGKRVELMAIYFPIPVMTRPMWHQSLVKQPRFLSALSEFRSTPSVQQGGFPRSPTLCNNTDRNRSHKPCTVRKIRPRESWEWSECNQPRGLHEEVDRAKDDV